MGVGGQFGGGCGGERTAEGMHTYITRLARRYSCQIVLITMRDEFLLLATTRYI